MSTLVDFYKFGVLPGNESAQAALNNKGVGLRVALLGASIVNRCSPAPVSAGTYNVFTPANWFQWANARLEGKLKVVAYAGIGGNPIAAVQNRYATEVKPYIQPGDFVFVGGDGFGNSITSDISVSAMYSSWLTLVEAIIADGCIPIVATCPPNGNITNAAKAALWYGINKKVLDYCRSNTKVMLVRWDTPHSDPLETYPNSPSAKGWTIDNIHPQPKLSIKGFGANFYDVMQAACADIQGVPWHVHNADVYRLLDNPTMSGTVSGVATNWTLTGTGAVGTKVARTDLGEAREFQRITCTAMAANAVLASSSFTIPTVGDFIPVPGTDRVKGYTRIRLNSSVAPVNLKGIQADIQFNGSPLRTIAFATGATAAATGGTYADAGQYIPQNEWLVLETPEIVLPAGVTGIKMNITITRIASVNMTCEVDISDAYIEILPSTSAIPLSAAGTVD